MAPPTLVHTRADINRQFHEPLANPEKYQCLLKSLVQNECTFKIDDATGVEAICIPFKRVFQRCLMSTAHTVNGQKQLTDRWVNIEVTDENTNEKLRRTYGTEIERFLRAEQDAYKVLGQIPSSD